MANDLTIIENQLVAYEPKWTELVAGAGITPHQITQTVLVSLERTPSLMNCDRVSIIQAATSAACLGLQVDGVTGQAYLIPFKGKAQLVIGYKGYNTIAGRSGYIINGGLIREGDEYDYELGSGAFVRVKPKLEGTQHRKIVAAWACATRPGFSNIVSLLPIDDIMAIKARSPGAKKKDSPWNDPVIGFPAMAEKSAKRRLARAMPLNLMQTAAVMEEAFDERGRHAYIDPGQGVMIEGNEAPALTATAPAPEAPPVSVETQYALRYPSGGRDPRFFNSIEQWAGFWEVNIPHLATVHQVDSMAIANDRVFEHLRASFPEEVDRVMTALTERKKTLQS